MKLEAYSIRDISKTIYYRCNLTKILALIILTKGSLFWNNYLDFIALINRSVRLSARAFCSEITAQIAAGIQPMSVTCKIKQIIAVNIFPLNRKDKNGKKIANRVIIIGRFVKNISIIMKRNRTILKQ